MSSFSSHSLVHSLHWIGYNSVDVSACSGNWNALLCHFLPPASSCLQIQSNPQTAHPRSVISPFTWAVRIFLSLENLSVKKPWEHGMYLFVASELTDLRTDFLCLLPPLWQTSQPREKQQSFPLQMQFFSMRRQQLPVCCYEAQASNQARLREQWG